MTIKNKLLQAICMDCQQPFEWGKNIHTEDGVKEAELSGMCEECFDDLFSEDDMDEQNDE